MKSMDKIKKGLEKRQSGFSLMELMVVVAIIGIMSAISIPMLMNPENKARKAARELMGDIQKTRMGAIKSNTTWGIVFIPAENRYKICSGEGVDGVWSAHADNPTEKDVFLNIQSAGVRFGGGGATFDATVAAGAIPSDGVSYTNEVLTFNPQGTCGNGYIYIFIGDASYAIGTLTTGIVRIHRWHGGDWQ